MKLIYFVQYYKPEKASGGVLVEDLLEGFAKHGWKVDVYTPTPTRGVSKEVRKEYSKFQKKKEVMFDGNLTIHRMSLYNEKGGFVSRTIRYSIFSFQCLLKGLLEPGEIVFSGSGPPTQGIVGGLIHKWTKKKFVYNLQDIFPDSLINSGMAKESSKIVKIGRKIEQFTYKNADVIITISEDMERNVIAKKVDANKIKTVRNWIDVEKIIPVDRGSNSLFDELHLNKEKFYVTYAGNIGHAQGIELIVKTAELLKYNDDIKFVIFGNGSEEDKVRKQIEEKNLGNISLFPLQSAERMSEVYSLGNVSLVSCTPGTGASGMPSKTWIIMASGTPVLGFFDLGGEFEKVIKEAECGICIEAGKIQELADAIVDLSLDKDALKKYGINARKYAEEYVSKEKAVDKYIDIIEAVYNSPKKKR